MHIYNSIILEFGLGSIGITPTVLKPTDQAPIEAKPVEGIVFEQFTKQFEIGTNINKECNEFLHTELPAIIFAFHSLEGLEVLQEVIDILRKKFKEQQS